MLNKDDWRWGNDYPVHICNDASLFHDLYPARGVLHPARGADNALVPLRFDWAGKVTLLFELEHSQEITVLHNVAFVPSAKSCYFSVKAALRINPGARCGSVTSIHAQQAIFDKAAKMQRAQAHSIGAVLVLDATPWPPPSSHDASKDWMAWHRRLGHVGRDRLVAALRHARIDMPTPCPARLPFCNGCEAAATAQDTLTNMRLQDPDFAFVPVRTPPDNVQAQHKLDIVVADIAGPYNYNGMNGSKYMLLIVDVRTRYLWLYTMSSPRQTFAHFRKWYDEVASTCTWRLRTLQTEEGNDLCSIRLVDLYDALQIRHETFEPGHLQKEGMGIVKRAIRTIEDMVRPMLHGPALRKSLWAQAALYAAWLRNRLPTQALGSASPYKHWYNERPDLQRVSTFGACVWLYAGRNAVCKMVYLRPVEGSETDVLIKSPRTNQLHQADWSMIRQIDEKPSF
ncbi:hypothetical protein ACQY0O_002614 [Thecaphora frezii]